MPKQPENCNKVRLVLPREAIEEYQIIYKRLYGREISYQEAQSQGVELLNLYKAVYRPIRKEWVKLK